MGPYARRTPEQPPCVPMRYNGTAFKYSPFRRHSLSAISWRPVLVVKEAGERRTTDHGQATGKLYQLRLQVWRTFLQFTKPGAKPRRIDYRLVLVVR